MADPCLIPPRCRPIFVPLSLELVGAYGLRVNWSDGHGTGIYTFERLLAGVPASLYQPRPDGVTSDTSGIS